MSQYGIVIYTSYRINFLTIKAASLLLMVELEQQGNKAMKKIICLAMIAWTMWVVPAEAQYDENDYSGYYGQTGPAESNGNGSYNGNPIIYVFYNNDPCDSCGEAIAMIEQTYRQNWQGIYDFYIVNYQDEEDAGNYTFTENYNLELPLTVVLQYVNDGYFTKYQKLPYLYNFNPYTYQEAFLSEVSTFFENYLMVEDKRSP